MAPPKIIGYDPYTGYALISWSDPAIIDNMVWPTSTTFIDPPMLSQQIEDWRTCPGTIINLPIAKTTLRDESETGYPKEAVFGDGGRLHPNKVTHPVYNPNKSYDQIIAEGAAIVKRLAAAKAAKRAARAAAAAPPREPVDQLTNLTRNRECLAAAEAKSEMGMEYLNLRNSKL